MALKRKVAQAGPGNASTPAASKAKESRDIESAASYNSPSSAIAFSDPVLARIEDDEDLRNALNFLKDKILTEERISNCKPLRGLRGKSGKLKLPNGQEVPVVSAHATGNWCVLFVSSGVKWELDPDGRPPKNWPHVAFLAVVDDKRQNPLTADANKGKFTNARVKPWYLPVEEQAQA